jgi:hypothetical protein
MPSWPGNRISGVSVGAALLLASACGSHADTVSAAGSGDPSSRPSPSAQQLPEVSDAHMANLRAAATRFLVWTGRLQNLWFQRSRRSESPKILDLYTTARTKPPKNR